MISWRINEEEGKRKIRKEEKRKKKWRKSLNRNKKLK